MKYAIIEKARPHKYIRRTGMSGSSSDFKKAVDSDIKSGVAARLITEDGYQVWGAFPRRTRPIRSYSVDDDAEKELDRIVNELTDSIWANMKYVIIEKARSHKYIRRTGMPGKYEYVYEEPGQYERAQVSKIDKYQKKITEYKNRLKELEQVRGYDTPEHKYWFEKWEKEPDLRLRKVYQKRMSVARSKPANEQMKLEGKIRSVEKEIVKVKTNFNLVNKLLKESYMESRWIASSRVKGWGSHSSGYSLDVKDNGLEVSYVTGGSFPTEEYIQKNWEHFKSKILPKFDANGIVYNIDNEKQTIIVPTLKEDLEKARSHKYIKRTGVPGHFDYFYSEEAQRDAEQDIGGIEDLRTYKPELTTDDKKLREELKKLLVVKEGSGEYRPTKVSMLEDKIRNLKSTGEAYEFGKKITIDQAIEIWKIYKQRLSESPYRRLGEILDSSIPLTPELKEEVQKISDRGFVTQMYLETVAGHLGESNLNESSLAFTYEEIEEKLGLK